jgi:hypothetical protein
MAQAPKRSPYPEVAQVFLTKPFDILGERRVFVIPPKVHIGGEDSPKEILWINETGGPVTIWLPNADHYLNEYKDPVTQEVHEFITPFSVPDKGELLVTIQENPDYGYYEYNVYCKVIDNYAQGESAPGVSCP